MDTNLNLTKSILGNWRITETELWDLEALDLVTQASLSLKPAGVGQIALIAIEAQLDYRVVMRDGLPGIEFSFEGFDEGDEVFGRGWAVLDEDQLRGRLFFHQGDDSSFVAQRKPRKSPANNALQPMGRARTAGAKAKRRSGAARG
jgi:hypothetical protein